ncbi:MAG: tetratricopeptide repeat protein, partial [Chloroflexia bacterium]
AVRRGEYNAARKLLEEAVEMSKKVGDKRYMAFASAALAEVTWYMGNPIKARNQYTESLALYRELGDRRGEANTLRNLGHLAHREGDERLASNLYYQSLRIERELRSEPNKALLLGALAGLVGSLGNAREAARLLGISDNALKIAGGILPPIDRIQRKYTLETLRAILGDSHLQELMVSGEAISLEKGLQLINFDLPQ